MKKSYYIGLGIVVLLILAFVWGQQSPSPSVIKIGYVGPLTGSLGVSTGESVREGLQFANKERPTVGDKRIELMVEDDACDGKKAVTATQKLLNVDHVDVLITMCSGSMLAMAPIAEANKTILISPVAGAPSITDAGDYVFRISASSKTSGGAAALYAREKGYKKAAVLFEQNEFPVGWKNAFVKTFTEGDPTRSVVTEGAALGTTDVKTQLLKLSQGKPDVLVFATLTSPMAHAALQQARDLGYIQPILGNETFSLKAVTKTGLAKDVFASVYKYDATSPQFIAFHQQYERMFQHPVQEEIYAALAYDTYQVLYSAFTSCKSAETDCVKNYLYAINDRTGLSGTYSIDHNGDTEREFVMQQVK